MTAPTPMSRCPWSGVEFDAVKIGGHDKVFASSANRAAAHKAARQYTEWMITIGHLSWDSLRRWSDRQTADGASYTARPTPPDPEQPALPLNELELS